MIPISETVNYDKLFCYFFMGVFAVEQFDLKRTMFYMIKRLSHSINESYFW